MNSLQQELHTKLKTLYAKIPKVENCIQGCTDCCGPVPFSIVEATKAKTTPGISLCLDCPFSLEGKCDIYNDRPLMCRLFAAVDTPQMTCPHGAKAAKLLTQEESAAILSEYMEIQEHEKGLLPSEEEELASLRARRRAQPSAAKRSLNT